MTPARWRLILLVIAAYAAVLVAWLCFGRWLAPQIITSSTPVTVSKILNRVIEATKWGSPYAGSALNHWRDFTGAVLIAGLLHLALVVQILMRAPSRDGTESRKQRLMQWSCPVLISFSFACLAYAVYRGGIQDYYFFIQMWREIQFGHDPWFYAYGVFGKYPMNAYGPLFNIFALPAWFNPLFPKLLFASSYLAFANWLVLKNVSSSPGSRLPWPLFVFWFWMPYCWIEIAEFGHFDVLVGLLCVAAVAARLRQRDVDCGIWLGLGVLLKLMPIVLLPFLMLDGRRLRYRLPVAAVVTILLGFGASLLIWGPSTFRPLLFAAQRSSHHLSIYRFLKGPYSPLRWIGLADDLDPAAPFFLVAALAWTWWLVRKRGIATVPSVVLAILVTLMFYQVGFAQYHMVLFVLASYWILTDGRPLRETFPIWMALACYFGWLSYFNVLLATTDIDSLGMQTWIGLPTFLLGSLLAFSIVRATEIAAWTLSKWRR